MTSLVDLVLDVDRALERAGVEHGFGGALALGYMIDPRGTVDVDVCVFVGEDELAPIDDGFGRIGLARTTAGGPPIAGVRYGSPDHPFVVDVFPAIDERYERVRARLVRHPFGRDPVDLPFLSAEDVVVFKLSFGRTKDWLDLTEVARTVDDLDMDYIEAQLVGLRGPTMYPRLARFRGLRRRT